MTTQLELCPENLRKELVYSGLIFLGFDFYMVDSSENKYIRAASFHIENEKDIQDFISIASPFISWTFSDNPTIPTIHRHPTRKPYDVS